MNNLDRNCSLDIFRYFCALLVVAIHIHPFMDVNYSMGYLATQIIPRIAVPFFFVLSGYYFIQNLYNNSSVFKTVRKIFIVYILWSVIYLSIYIFNSISNSVPLIVIIKECMLKFFILGSYYHLWFFPALFFAMGTVFIAHKLKFLKLLFIISLIFYIIGCIGCSWYEIGNKITFLSTIINLHEFNIIRRILFMGLPFFMVGYLLNIFKTKYGSFINKKLMLILIITSICFLIEIFFVIKLGLQKNIILTFFLYPLLTILTIILLKNPLQKLQNIAYKARITSNFIYYSHPLIIIFISIIFQKIGITVKETLMYIVVCFITSMIGYIIAKIDKFHINNVGV
ncbi:MAG: acyltransferase [Endomicrobiaceae bacterium]|nr:acyltransferase [Endomicrobiaceae bacterium]